ncbi:MAG: VOC family protein [Rhizomicrobium sp.]
MHPEDFTRRATLGLAAAAIVAGEAKADSATPKEEKERVVGIGGFFFRAKDPKALAHWYDINLGVAPVPENNDMQPWRTEAGTTTFAPFKANTTYFGDPAKQWMINFRVRDLDKMAAQLRANGVAVEVDPQTYPYGKFAKLVDPEGNPIQLWQPIGKDSG